MKTSNKLLLGLLIIVLASITVILIAARFYVDRNTISGNGKQASKTRQLEKFDKVNINGRFTVLLSQGENSQLKINADENLIPLVESTVDNGELVIKFKDKISRKDKVKLFITADAYNQINMRAGAEFRTTSELKGDLLNLEVSAGSHGTLKANYNELKCDVSAGAGLTLTGRTAMATLMASSGSSLIAQELIAQKAVARGSSGASMNIVVTEELDAEMSSGASLTYSGNPVIKNINTSSGGNINKN